METGGGGWTLFQSRMDGSVDFYRSWQNYVHGFGSLEDEHWLGLSKIHRLANGSVANELRVEMEDFEGNARYAKYLSFYIEGSSADYKLHVSGYSGSSGDALAYHNGKKFTTKENDNDDHDQNCAVQFSGAWWYSCCHHSNPNGLYGDNTYGKGINWYQWKGHNYSLKYIQFKLRRA